MLVRLLRERFNGGIVFVNVNSAPQPIGMDGDAGRNHPTEIRLARAVGSGDDESNASTNRHDRRFVLRYRRILNTLPHTIM